ncbi:MAG: hypothetical protein JXB50_16970 [Spirochaetes bacterium]|nr:hypothetical protein [Spirochaetota bacterium]
MNENQIIRTKSENNDLNNILIPLGVEIKNDKGNISQAYIFIPSFKKAENVLPEKIFQWVDEVIDISKKYFNEQDTSGLEYQGIIDAFGDMKVFKNSQIKRRN